jgi:Ca2+-binding EF-hand superfamily protein
MDITGETGIYNSSTREGYAKNTAYNVMQHDKQVKSSNSKNLDEIEFENIRYSMLQQATKDEYIKDAKIYADESIKALSDKGKVSKEDFIPKDAIPAMREMLTKFFNVIDLNNDGYIDTNENTAHVMVMDCAKISDDLKTVTMETPDGVIDSHNKKNIDRYILESPEQAQQLLKEQNIE